MLNYEIAPSVLAPYVPAGTELDLWNDRHLVSVVGFRFLRTRVLGIPIPFHRNFEEVNLRFYVRRKTDGGWRRGVVFIKEIVPRAAIAFLARTLYNEPYIALPMAHRIETTSGLLNAVEYSWRFRGRENRLKLRAKGEARPVAGRFGGRVHHGTLLGLQYPTRRFDDGISRGTSALARLEYGFGATGLRRGRNLPARNSGLFEPTAVLRFSGRRIGSHGCSRWPFAGMKTNANCQSPTRSCAGILLECDKTMSTKRLR